MSATKPTWPADPAPPVRGAALRDAAALLRRRWWVVLLCVVLIPAVVYVYGARQAKLYRATVTVEAEDTAVGTLVGDNLVSNPNSVATLDGYADAIPVVAATYRAVGSYGTLSGLSSDLDKRTKWVTLSATARNPRLSIRGASAYAAALTQYSRSIARSQLETAITGARQTLAATRNPVQRRQAAAGLSKLIALRQAQTRPVQVIQAGSASVASPHPARNAGMALILAVLIVPALVVAFDRLDRRLRRPTELERLCGAPLLATIPTEAFAAGQGGPRSEAGFQRLRDSLMFLSADRQPDTVAIVSPLGGEGRTTVATGLALACARSGRRVVLVDADLRGQGVAARMGVPGTPGLVDVIVGDGVDDALCPIEGSVGELNVLPAGSPSPRSAEALGSQEMSALLERLSDRCDVVVIDTAPLLAASDTLPLLGQTSGIVAVARIDRTPRDAVRRMMRLVAAARGQVLGVVATGARPARGVVAGAGEEQGLGGYRQGAAGNDAPPPTSVARLR